MVPIDATPTPGKPPCQWGRLLHDPGIALPKDTRIAMLWDQLADFEPQRHREAMRHCMLSISDWIGARSAFWVGSVRVLDERQRGTDPLGGWRIGCIRLTHPETMNLPIRAGSGKAMYNKDPGDPTRALVADTGRFRLYSMHTGFLDLERFRQTEHYEYFYRRPGITDRIWVVFPLNPDVESTFVFDTHTPGHVFSQQDLLLVGTAMRGMKWFHRQQLMAHGLGISHAPLTPAERKLLPELLTGDVEKTIAARVGLTQATVHQYATAIYRKLGVHGRTEFMALWLRTPRSPPTPPRQP